MAKQPFSPIKARNIRDFSCSQPGTFSRSGRPARGRPLTISRILEEEGAAVCGYFTVEK